MEKILNNFDIDTIKKFENSIYETLTFYLIKSAANQGILNQEESSFLVHNIDL
ncbi:MAG TPA: hypothetical protein OIM45_03370 [Clostridiaceae bacterium]|nr:hypothetical protein [Clostridiaceae bacterium]